MKLLPPEGQAVVLTLCNKNSPMKGGPLAEFIPDTYEIRGVMGNKPKWDKDPEHICVIVPGSPVPMRIVDFSKVLQVNGVGTGNKPSRAEEAFQVAGSKPGITYTVTCKKGKWFCTCPGFNFNKSCKHIEQARVKHA